MDKLKRILRMEDDPKDIELSLEAFGEHSLANDITIAQDGHWLRATRKVCETVGYLFISSINCFGPRFKWYRRPR